MLRVEALAVARGGLRLLEGVSLSLSAGQALMLRGPNGIGKTTLLRCVAGLQRADSGTITVDPDHIAYAGHSDGVKATLSVRENLVFWGRMNGHRPDSAPIRLDFSRSSISTLDAPACLAM